MEWPNINIETFQFATVATEIQIWKRVRSSSSEIWIFIYHDPVEVVSNESMTEPTGTMS